MIGFFYGQTEYNMLKSSLRIDDYINKASQFGFKALSITDHNMYAHYKFYKMCKDKNIKPIIGLEINVESKDQYECKMLAYAIDNNGYQGLLKLSTLDRCEDKVFTIKELAGYRGILFVSTNNSDIYRYASAKDVEKVTEIINEYSKELYEFGIGISLCNKDEYKSANILRDMSLELGFKIYPLSQTLYDLKEDEEVYKALRLIDNEEVIEASNHHYKTKEELEEEFFMYEMCFENFAHFVEEVNVDIKPVVISFPKFPNTNGLSSKEYLKALCERGLQRRLQTEMNAPFEVYTQRLEYELSVINKMNYDDCFLITWDYIRFAKKEGIMVGPGRGSAAGSLVAYTLGITNVDPMKYNLLFERFLNPERITLPDIDTDFPDDRRDEVIKYVQSVYGKERVCHISAYGTFQIKSSIRDLGRVLKMNSNELDVIVKIASNTNDYDGLINQYRNNPQVYKLLSIAKKIENLPRHISTHAAGIILSNEPLVLTTALQPGLNGLYQSQLEASDLEKLGLLKLDFLGLKNLAIISDICQEIPNMNNITISQIPFNDKKTYELLKRGDTLGVFQLEKEGMKKFLRELKPDCFEDIVAALALYRPGPMDNIPEYIARKNGKKFSYLHPNLEPILKSTYGIIVYQEQIMQIAYEFAGFSLGEADVLRRAVSKKDKHALDSNRKLFVERSIKKGYSEAVANQIYDYILKFANYGFNKSHSVVYSVISYQMAYFKANYFALFMSKLLNNVIGNTTTVNSYIEYAKKYNLRVKNPDINKSGLEFVADFGALLFPLQGIFGLGTVIARDIVNERKNGKFTSFEDFKARVPSANQKVLEALIFAGAFDSFGKTRKSLLENSDSLIDVFSGALTADEIIIKNEQDYEQDYLREMERKYIGFNIKYDLFSGIEKMRKIIKAQVFQRQLLNTKFDVILEFKAAKEIKTKDGNAMLVGEVFDGQTQISCVIFPQSYSLVSNIIETGRLYKAFGRLIFNDKKNAYEFQIEAVSKFEL